MICREMAQYLNDQLEYIAEDNFNMSDSDDNEFVEDRRQGEAVEGSDLEGDRDQVSLYISFICKEVGFF